MIGYESGKCMLAVQGGILGGHKSVPVSHKHMLSHSSFSSPLINKDLQAGPQLVFTLNNRFSATKHVTVCFQPSQADRRTASLVYINIRSLTPAQIGLLCLCVLCTHRVGRVLSSPNPSPTLVCPPPFGSGGRGSLAG